MIENGKISPTLDTSCEIGVVEDEYYGLEEAGKVDVTEFDGKIYKIRKLTPKECFRLQGFPDEYFKRAAAVCSDSQLYKQAGNSVTVNVIYEIARRLG